MGIKVKTTVDVKKFEKAFAALETLNGRKVNIGMPSGSKQAQIAAVHEWGLTITVTDKMRKWFIAQGHPLKKTTTQIVIPERSFFRSGMRDKGSGAAKKYTKLIAEVIKGTISVEQFLNGLGLEVTTVIKEYARDLSSPENSGFTVERKGSSNPLVDTGNMIGAINYKVE
nr:MAG TPA: virion morphogenesis protein [Bacteriophage sp.]